MISLIFAKSHNGVIGHNGKLPWPRLAADMRWFRQHTIDKTIVMGHTTFKSIGNKALPGRKNIVLSKTLANTQKDVTIARSIDDILESAAEHKEVLIIGGAQVYKQFLPYAQKLYQTNVHTTCPGDTIMPTIDYNQFKCVFTNHQIINQDNPHEQHFSIWNKYVTL